MYEHVLLAVNKMSISSLDRPYSDEQEGRQGLEQRSSYGLAPAVSVSRHSRASLVATPIVSRHTLYSLPIQEGGVYVLHGDETPP